MSANSQTGDGKDPNDPIDTSGFETGTSTSGDPEKIDTSGFETGASTSGTPQKMYTVKKGDSLSKIAKEFYGDMKEWKKIYEANRDQIKDPNLIQIGQELVIPE